MKNPQSLLIQHPFPNSTDECWSTCFYFPFFIPHSSRDWLARASEPGRAKKFHIVYLLFPRRYSMMRLEFRCCSKTTSDPETMTESSWSSQQNSSRSVLRNGFILSFLPYFDLLSIPYATFSSLALPFSRLGWKYGLLFHPYQLKIQMFRFSYFYPLYQRQPSIVRGGQKIVLVSSTSFISSFHCFSFRLASRQKVLPFRIICPSPCSLTHSSRPVLFETMPVLPFLIQGHISKLNERSIMNHSHAIFSIITRPSYSSSFFWNCLTLFFLNSLFSNLPIVNSNNFRMPDSPPPTYSPPRPPPPYEAENNKNEHKVSDSARYRLITSFDSFPLMLGFQNSKNFTELVNKTSKSSTKHGKISWSSLVQHIFCYFYSNTLYNVLADNLGVSRLHLSLKYGKNNNRDSRYEVIFTISHKRQPD